MAIKEALSQLTLRFWRLISSVSVRTKIMGIVLALVLILGLGVTFQVRMTMEHLLRAELENRGVSITRELATRSTDPILTNDLFALYELIQDTVEQNEDVRYAFILDSGGNLLVHSFGPGFPSDLLWVNSVASKERYRLRTLDTEEGLIHDIAVPIFEGRAGTARVGLSESRMRQTVALVIRQLLVTTLLISLIGISAGYFLTKVLTRPLLALVKATRSVAKGDFSQRVPPWANDEIGHLTLSFNNMVEELEMAYRELERKEALRQQLLEELITSQEEERKRISLELHDETGQALTSLLVRLTTLGNSSRLKDVKEKVGELKMLVAHTLEAVQDLSLKLRPRVLDDLGLATALERYLRTCAVQYGLAVDFQMVGPWDGRLPSYIEINLYRIIQEALTNVARHAEATSVSVLLERRGTSVIAIVEDNGKGFHLDEVLSSAEEKRRLGLYGMEERASLMGGRLTIESSLGAGTTLFVEIPLNEEI